jgi:tRNA threonylcarbamoyladenosine dehydratase
VSGAPGRAPIRGRGGGGGTGFGFLRPVAPGEPGSWEHRIFRIAAGERAELRAAADDAGVRLVDTLDRQLQDLAEVRLPGEGPARRSELVDTLLADAGGRNTYGCWAFLPGDRAVVRLLPEEEYFQVITSRNHDKITEAEQRSLRSRRVGVIGLSVGAEAAVTLAQEHLCGELRLADFDVLELSNLNRIGAGVAELGENKAILAARRVARINPYLPVELYPEGVSEGNMDAFLDGLDLLVEECDDLPMKFGIRERARSLGLDVIFAADERGFLSVEPYARYPALRPFHGRVPARPLPRDAEPSTEAFLRALTEWLGGWEEISPRSRRSVERIGKALAGYPQLASEARYAAGQLGHVARRLLLGESLPPFARHLDLDELLPRATPADPL